MDSVSNKAKEKIDLVNEDKNLSSTVDDRKTEQGVKMWSKDDPTTDGIYWWHADAADADPDIHFVQGESFYQVGFGSSEWVANFGGEWLGPISPSYTEELLALREAHKGLMMFFPAVLSLAMEAPLTGKREAIVGRAREAYLRAHKLTAGKE